MKVKLYAGGAMGQIARDILESLDSVELVGEYATEFDILFSASFPAKIPVMDCRIAALGAVNIHTSLLPEGRGSHPLNWALIWGKPLTGVTIHKITQTYDAGDICVQEEVPIFDTDNIVSLRERVEDTFRKVIVAFFDQPEEFLRTAKPQNQAHASYAQKRLPEDGLINFNASPREIYNFVRAHHPVEYPAFFFRGQTRVNVVGARMEGDYCHLIEAR